MTYICWKSNDREDILFTYWETNSKRGTIKFDSDEWEDNTFLFTRVIFTLDHAWIDLSRVDKEILASMDYEARKARTIQNELVQLVCRDVLIIIRLYL